MTASIVMGTLSFVRLICAGTSTVFTRVSMRFAIFSRNGFMVMRPGPRMPRNFPRRSTATRSHSWTMAIARARMASATVATRTAATHSRTISILRAPTHARYRFQARDGTPMESKPAPRRKALLRGQGWRGPHGVQGPRPGQERPQARDRRARRHDHLPADQRAAEGRGRLGGEVLRGPPGLGQARPVREDEEGEAAGCDQEGVGQLGRPVPRGAEAL